MFWPNLQNVNKLDYNVSHSKCLWKKTDECYAIMSLHPWEVYIQKKSVKLACEKLKTKFKKPFYLEGLNPSSFGILNTFDSIRLRASGCSSLSVSTFPCGSVNELQRWVTTAEQLIRQGEQMEKQGGSSHSSRCSLLPLTQKTQETSRDISLFVSDPGILSEHFFFLIKSSTHSAHSAVSITKSRNATPLN